MTTKANGTERKPIDELLDGEKLRLSMAQRRVTQVGLSKLLDRPCTTLNGWLVGRHPAPVDLPSRIEEVLGLKPGALAKSSTKRSA